MRRAEKARRKLGLDERRRQAERRKAPKASWIKKSTRRGGACRRGEPDPHWRRAPRALGQGPAHAQEGARRVHVRNQSMAAKQILQTANLAVATTGARPCR